MKPYVCNVGKKTKIDAKRTIPLMQHMIINKIMTNVTKKNQYSNKIGVKRNVLIVPRIAVLTANSLEVIDSCILYIYCTQLERTHFFKYVDLYM